MDELVDRARHGDREAFATLVQLTGDRMYALAARILRDADPGRGRPAGRPHRGLEESLPTLRDPAFEVWLRRLLVRACYAEAGREP